MTRTETLAAAIIGAAIAGIVTIVHAPTLLSVLLNAIGGALICATTYAWAKQSVAREAALLAVLLSLLSAGALVFLGQPATVLAVGLAGLAFVEWRARPLTLLGGPTAAVIVAVLSPALGVALAGALWWRAPRSRARDAIALVTSIAIAILPSDAMLQRAVGLAVLAGLAMLFRRPLEQRTLTRGGRRMILGTAAIMPAAGLGFLLFADGHVFALASDDLLRAWFYAAAALIVAAVAGIAIVGAAMVLSTRNGSRLASLGALIAAAVSMPLVGLAAGLVLLLPAASAFGVGVLLLAPGDWRGHARRAWARLARRPP